MHKHLILALCLVTSSGFAANGLKEGQWEYTSTTQMAGMPSMSAEERAQFNEAMKHLPPGTKLPGSLSMNAKGMTSTFKQCVKSDSPVPTDPRNKDCQVTQMNRSGNTYTWAMHCKTPDGEMDGNGTGTYDGDNMTSKIQIKGTSRGQPIDMTMDITGRYLGACK
jgi:hypothetical protein